MEILSINLNTGISDVIKKYFKFLPSATTLLFDDMEYKLFLNGIDIWEK